MTFRRLLLALDSSRPFSLISPDYIDRSVLSFSRAQTGATSSAISSGGAASAGNWWTEFAADTPRFAGTARRLMLGGQRTTMNTRQRLIGGTGWSINNLTATATTGPDGGAATASRLDEGTATVARVTSVGNVSHTAGVYYSMSAIVKAETCTTCQMIYSSASFGTAVWQNFDLANGVLGTGGASTLNPRIVALGNGWYWVSMGGLCTTTVGANPLALYMTPSASHGRAGTYTGTNRTMLAFWGWAETGAAFPSSAFLAATEPNAATRGQDNATASFARLFPRGTGTVLASFVLPFAAAGGVDQALFDINDGTLNNRIRLRNVAGGSTLVAGRLIAGASSDAASIGSMTPGTLFRVGLTFDGSTITANFNGGANQTVAGQPAGLTTLRVGNNNPSGTAPMFGEVGIFNTLPYALSSLALATAVTEIT